MTELLLSPAEARVIAALAEKSVTTPQYYPMSVNAIMLAANQKTCRSPVLSLSEGDTGAALNQLESLSLCTRNDNISRVPKWRQNFQHHLLLKPDAFALLVTLMLRGPQTLSELRANASGLGGPGDTEGAAALLKDLTDRAQPLVVLLPRAPGRKEARYAHTLCGVPTSDSALGGEAAEATAAPRPNAPALQALEQRLKELETRVVELERAAGKVAPMGDSIP